MAIQTHIVGERGELHANSYCRIERIMVSRTEMHIEYGVFKNIEEARLEVPPFLILNVYGSHTLNGEKNIWQQAYEIIKNRHPEYLDI